MEYEPNCATSARGLGSAQCPWGYTIVSYSHGLPHDRLMIVCIAVTYTSDTIRFIVGRPNSGAF